MTKKTEEKVRVFHPGYQAVATPLKRDLAAWQAQGWAVTPEPETKETEK